jgi:hypothetical protein
LPASLAPKHGVKDDEQLADAGGERRLGVLAACARLNGIEARNMLGRDLKDSAHFSDRPHLLGHEMFKVS